MLNIVSMNRAGLSDERLTFIVTFEFDNASTLPERAFNVGNMSYVLAKGSTAKNVVTGINYEYSGSKWLKVTGTTNNTNTVNNKITDNGDYNVVNNDFVGFSDVTVDVSGESPTLITKTITENNTYNASDDEADGYSSVTVNVSSEPNFNYLRVPYISQDYSIKNSYYLTSNNEEYNILEYGNNRPNYPVILLSPLTKIIGLRPEIENYQYVIFTPSDNFDYSNAFYFGEEKPSYNLAAYFPTYNGDTITAGDGNWYKIQIDGYFHNPPIVKKYTSPTPSSILIL